MSNMYEVSGVDSSTALWGAVVFAEDSLGKSLPSASELFSLCPQPIPSDPTPQYVLQGLVRWRQRGSLAGQPGIPVETLGEATSRLPF